MTVGRRFLACLASLLFSVLIGLGGEALRSSGSLLLRLAGWVLEIAGFGYALLYLFVAVDYARFAFRGLWRMEENPLGFTETKKDIALIRAIAKVEKQRASGK
jgi:hypothetical protein